MTVGDFPLSSSCRCYLLGKAITRTTLSFLSSLHTNFPSVLLIMIVTLIIIIIIIIIIITIIIIAITVIIIIIIIIIVTK